MHVGTESTWILGLTLGLVHLGQFGEDCSLRGSPHFDEVLAIVPPGQISPQRVAATEEGGRGRTLTAASSLPSAYPAVQ